MGSVSGLAGLKKKLQANAKKYGVQNADYTVGFTQKYAVFVHEIKRNYRVGDYKYLEKPYRELHAELLRDIGLGIENGGDLDSLLLKAALKIQRKAVKRNKETPGEGVPVDTGALRASSFVTKTSDLEAAAAAAYLVSEAIRKAELAKRKTSKAKKKKKR